MNSDKLIILMTSDQDEFFLFQRALKRLLVTNPIRVIPTLAELRQYLGVLGVFKDREIFPLPALTLLDLDQEEAPDFVRWARANPRTRDLLIVGLSEHSINARLQQFYDLGINACFQKRLNVEETVRLIRDVQLIEEIFNYQTQPG